MEKTSVDLIEFAEPGGPVRGRGAYSYYPYFNFAARDQPDSAVKPNEDWIGQEESDRVSLRADRHFELMDGHWIWHRSLEKSDLVFVEDGMLPRVKGKAIERVSESGRDLTHSGDVPIERTVAWAIYMQQTGRMG